MEPDLLDFLDRHIRTVEQLELLLFLASTPHRGWTSQALGAELRRSASSAEQRMDELAHDGFLVVQSESPRAYRYDPANERARAIQRLADRYAQFRSRIIERIVSKGDLPRDFARTFRRSSA